MVSCAHAFDGISACLTSSTEMKLMIAAIYSNYTSHIVNDEGVANQSDGYTSRPASEQLYLRFEKVV